ncbi:MAG: DUF4097 family beta strand repeat protein [Clostridia bacterium]|nr:DUF4097 family beta strand repeat protein [Clostridia bacterium]
MIKKIILAITFFGIFVLTFAAGVGLIILGAGDFSWDIVSRYVSMSDVAKINDKPISNLFSFSDHTEFVGSHAEGKIGCPTDNGIIIFENIAEELTVTSSPDEYIHITVDGKIRESSTVKSAKNLTGTNIPDIQFECNRSTDEAIIKIRKLRGKDITLRVELPAGYKGNIRLKNIAGKMNIATPLDLASLKIEDAAGKVSASGVSADTLALKEIAGEVELSEGTFSKVTVTDSAGKANVSGTIGSFRINNIMGRINLESDAPLTGDCDIVKIMGTVDITLPKGSKFMLTKKDVVGIVTPLKGDKKADYTIAVENIVGKVSIDR